VVLCPPHFRQAVLVAGLNRADTIHHLTFGNADPSRRRMRAHPRFRVFPQPGSEAGKGWMPTRQGGGSVVDAKRSRRLLLNVLWITHFGFVA